MLRIVTSASRLMAVSGSRFAYQHSQQHVRYAAAVCACPIRQMMSEVVGNVCESLGLHSLLPSMTRKRVLPSTFENIHRVDATDAKTDGIVGTVHWAPSKSLFIGGMNIAALVGGIYTFSPDAVAFFLGTTATTLCLGHSLGMHRRLIHNSYQCPLWLEHTFVYLGTLIGMAGPYGMVRTHDMRDWAQRQAGCHDYFAHRRSMLQDAWWQMHCDVALANPPKLTLEPRIANDRFYQFLEQTWKWQQLPVALAAYALGGMPYVIWGVCMRVSVSVAGHWLVGYYAHNRGERSYHVEGACVQGYNIPGPARLLGLISFGESWHNNHHAFPGSAKLAVRPGEMDAGWWVLRTLERFGLVWNMRLPQDLPFRPELKKLL
eukprot:TRINITY_DN12795_c0_g1_i1.p1 TRINITY_DN12795_c0_g1~~TRINITY_DN12795_c0_g1_i1.p1  ORF type:complete len:375 (-),score=58.56 TRINITY_DN12795_c0_g1_i1:168-1292(-)